MKIELKKVSTSRGHEGEPLFHADVYIDGVLAALYDDGDWGSECNWTVKDQAACDKLTAFAAVQTPHTSQGITLEVTAESVVTDMLEVIAQRKALTRKCAKSSLFAVKGKVGGYNEYKVAYTPAVAAELKTKLDAEFGADNYVFANVDLDAFLTTLMPDLAYVLPLMPPVVNPSNKAAASAPKVSAGSIKLVLTTQQGQQSTATVYSADGTLLRKLLLTKKAQLNAFYATIRAFRVKGNMKLEADKENLDTCEWKYTLTLTAEDMTQPDVAKLLAAPSLTVK